MRKMKTDWKDHENSADVRDSVGYKKRLILALFSCGLVSFVYFFYCPLSLIHANAESLLFDLDQVTGVYLIVFVLLTALLAGLLALLRPPVFDTVARLLFGLGVASYMQGSFMNPSFGIMDGRMIDWTTMGAESILNLLIWIAIFFVVYLASVYAQKYWRKILCGASALLIVMQLLALIPMYIETNERKQEDAEMFELSMDSLLTVSRKQNVLIFILDAMSNPTLTRTWEKYPESKEWFNDFTYFTNCAPTFYGTYPELLSMLTGSDTYDCSLSYKDFERTAWSSETAESFYGLLDAHGYRTDVFLYDGRYISSSYSFLEGKVANAVQGRPKSVINKRRMLKQMAELTVFICAPIGFKAGFQPFPDNLAQIASKPASAKEDLAAHTDNYSFCKNFYPLLSSEGLSLSSRKQFSLYHLWSSHPPYITDENCLPISKTDGTVEDQTRGYLLLVSEYMRQLKALGVYDDSLIIVAADHGDSNLYGFGRDPSAAFLIKGFGESHDAMRQNHAPITHLEVLPTVADAIAPESPGNFGDTVYDIPEDVPRPRKLYSWYREKPARSSYEYFLLFQYTCDINTFDEMTAPYEKYPLYDSFY